VASEIDRHRHRDTRTSAKTARIVDDTRIPSVVENGLTCAKSYVTLRPVLAQTDIGETE